MNYRRHALCVKGGQGRRAAELLSYWPGVFRILTVSAVLGCCVLAHYVIVRHRTHTVTIERVAP